MISRTKMLQRLIRAFSSESSRNQKICSKLFVAGLSFDTNESALKEAFSAYGEILEVKIIVDRRSYRSLGFGFIRFDKETDAESALKHMQGQVTCSGLHFYIMILILRTGGSCTFFSQLLQGRIIRLEYAHSPRQSQESKPQLKVENED
ncbi:unnamed protein product [Victoria cruziana]